MVGKIDDITTTNYFRGTLCGDDNGLGGRKWSWSVKILHILFWMLQLPFWHMLKRVIYSSVILHIVWLSENQSLQQIITCTDRIFIKASCFEHNYTDHYADLLYTPMFLRLFSFNVCGIQNCCIGKWQHLITHQYMKTNHHQLVSCWRCARQRIVKCTVQ